MKFTELENTFNVINKSEGRVVADTFSLPSEESKQVNPLRTTESILKKLEIHYKRKNIDVEFDVKVDKKKKGKSGYTVNEKTVKNDKGDENEHTVYNPEKAKKDSMINVESIEDSKAVEVEETTKVENNFTMDNAKSFLNQHWKKIQKEVDSMEDIQRLEFILSVAKELGMNGNKKYELVEERISQL